ncbi:MAG TPA: aminodeoxychorismate synthase component I [Bacteroidales bacterium]|nr:MAG: aminodeoxychorismate synthase component I [Bacteroidetes bacterium HGW-Bacteroidetes-22]HAQ64715.1 aminodeoxychorismate synthase component I [Bacteroidales bacterium]HBZ67311.1 aminodeoxychorismate synthase component I [Bacteroidales bacterium]
MNKYGAGRTPFVFLIDFLSEKPIVIPIAECAAHRLFFIFPESQVLPGKQEPLPEFGKFHFKPISERTYKRAFKAVKADMESGNTYLANLTFSTRVLTNLSPEVLLGHVSSRYQVQFEDLFFCFSPETFITIKDGLIRSCPMKGTIDADIPNAEALLRSNPKEKAEHNTITDLIRNDLNIIASGVHVSRPRYIEEVNTSGRKLLQMSSEISGYLPKGWHSELGNIIYKMLPAGSISGAPKEKTVEIILQTEQHRRGYYTGIFGVYDGNQVDSCVLIRFLEQNPKGFFHYKSGGGITINSKMEDEYNELIQKIYVPLV